MKIKIICVGKLKEKYLKLAVDEYTKRLSRFCKVEITELLDERIPDNPSECEIKSVLLAEGEKIKKYIDTSDYIIPLCIEGEGLSSDEFAKKMSSVMLYGKSTFTFIIGGSLGIDEKIKTMSDFKLSFSPMTFPHQLMRVMLLEQVFRCFKINGGESYHK